MIIMLNPGCWTSTPDVHGNHGVGYTMRTLDQCLATCSISQSCVAVDWQVMSDDTNMCWFLAEYDTTPTTQPGIITHYKRNQTCLSS